MKKWLCLIVTLVFLALLDVFIASPVHLKFSCYMPDNLLGWRTKRNYTREYTQKDSEGNSYKVLYSLDQNGFRAYDAPAPTRLKILFLGDSFTMDPKAGNKEMYFSVVKSRLRDKYKLDVAIFAAGGGGYGTLQEYLLIREYLPRIKPDILVLQFTDNDFVNNLYAWEKYSIARNQKYLRPYYSIASDSIYYAETLWARTYRFFYNKSFLFRGVDALIRRLQNKYYLKYFSEPSYIIERGYTKLTMPETEKLLQEAYPITRELLLLLRKEFSRETKLFMFFPPRYDPPFKKQWLKISRECGFTPLLSPIEALEDEISKGAAVFNYDGGHYSNLGNRVAGEAIADELFENMKRQGVMQ